jgi:hypothetical protein
MRAPDDVRHVNYVRIQKAKVSHCRPGQALRAPGGSFRLPEFLNSRHMKMARSAYAPATFTPWEILLALISVRGWVEQSLWYGRWQFFTHANFVSPRCLQSVAPSQDVLPTVMSSFCPAPCPLTWTYVWTYLVFSPFAARQLPLLVTRHLSSLIISCAAQLWALLLYTDTPFNVCMGACVRSVTVNSKFCTRVCVCVCG